MPAPDSPVLLVARFLRSNGYGKTLAAFLEETNLPASSADANGPAAALSIEQLLDEKRLFDLSLTLEKVDLLEDEVEFTTPYPTIPRLIAPPDAPQSNVLSVTLARTLDPYPHPVIIATTADRALRLYSPTGTLLASHPALHPSAILSVCVLDGKYLITTSMTGHVSISLAPSPTALFTVRPHTKYATASRLLHSNTLLATSSYDGSIAVHSITCTSGTPTLTPFARLQLPTPPEALAATTLPTGDPALVYSRRDSACLYYHHLTPSLPLHATQDLSGGSGSRAAFHAMALAPHPTDPTLLAVATSHVPVMKFLLVRVAGAVVKEVFSGAPQSAYSVGVLAWRPGGGGVWVAGDDGVVRGLDVRSGRVVAALGVCGGGEKVRALWAGEDGEGGERLLTGGFDKGLKVWRVACEGEEGEELDVEEVGRR